MLELMELLDMKGVGRVRARKLYKAGFRSLSELSGAAPEAVAAVVGPKIAERIFRQLGRDDAAGIEFSAEMQVPEAGEEKAEAGQKTFNDF